MDLSDSGVTALQVAASYTSSGGAIFRLADSIKAFKTDQTLKIEISDTGVGMDPSVQKKIFDPFYSFSDEGGTGLGMSIVKSVIEAHNGMLMVSSKPNGGTTFRVTLPLID